MRLRSHYMHMHMCLDNHAGKGFQNPAKTARTSETRFSPRCVVIAAHELHFAKR